MDEATGSTCKAKVPARTPSVMRLRPRSSRLLLVMLQRLRTAACSSSGGFGVSGFQVPDSPQGFSSSSRVSCLSRVQSLEAFVGGSRCARLYGAWPGPDRSLHLGQVPEICPNDP